MILIDEAHRTQGSLLNQNMFNAFPESTKIAFTGTPLITQRHNRKTHDTFGGYIDKYKLQDAVNDGATIPIIYEGKTQDSALKNKAEFDAKFEDLFKDRSAKEIEEIKRKYGTMGDILEAERYIEEIANDIICHYVDYILPNGFKAQVVTSSQMAAVRYQKYIDIAIKNRLKKEQAKTDPNQDIIKLLEFIKTGVVVSGMGTNEIPEITAARKQSKSLDVIESFKKQINFDNPNTGVAILIVCDMLLTGFDAPIEQAMYINKKLREHNLLQAIARVNRTYRGKSKGFIVDYIGIGNHLRDALEIYASDDQEDILNAMKDISTEIPILKDRYQRLINLFLDHGIDKITDYVHFKIKDAHQQFAVLESAIELLEDIKLRATFDFNYKSFIYSLDVIMPNAIANDYIKPAKAFGHIHNRVKHRYKDETINLSGVGNKVKRLVNEHLISLGIDPVVPPVMVLSKNFDIAVRGSKDKKAAASEMEHAIRKHIKINLDYDPVYFEKMSEKLAKVLTDYKDSVEQRYKSLLDLLDEIKEGRTDTEEGLDAKIGMPFYDLIIKIAFKGNEEITPDKKTIILDLVSQCIDQIRDSIRIVDFWNRSSEQSELKRQLSDLFIFSNVDEIIESEAQIIPEFMALAKRKQNEF